MAADEAHLLPNSRLPATQTTAPESCSSRKRPANNTPAPPAYQFWQKFQLARNLPPFCNTLRKPPQVDVPLKHSISPIKPCFAIQNAASELCGYCRTLRRRLPFQKYGAQKPGAVYPKPMSDAANRQNNFRPYASRLADSHLTAGQ